MIWNKLNFDTVHMKSSIDWVFLVGSTLFNFFIKLTELIFSLFTSFSTKRENNIWFDKKCLILNLCIYIKPKLSQGQHLSWHLQMKFRQIINQIFVSIHLISSDPLYNYTMWLAKRTRFGEDCSNIVY